MDTSLFCLFPFTVLSPKLQRIGNFFACSIYGNVFLVCCFTKHRALTAEFSFFLSKNLTYFFFEGMITLLYQPLFCGSPMGTMNFSMCHGIWLTEFSQSFACKFLSIIAIWKVFGIQTWKNAFCSACTTSSHVLDLNRMSQEYYFADGCYDRWCEVPNYDLGSKQGKFLKWVKAIHLK